MSPNSLSYLLTFGFLALFVTGCGGDTSKPSNSASPSPSTSAAASAAPVASAAPSFTQPVVAGADLNASSAPEVAVKSESMAAALLPASDSDTIVRNTTKGRTDPFANVVFQTETVVSRKSNPNGFNQIASNSSSLNNTSPNIGRNNISSSSVGASNSPRVGSGLGLASAAANAGKVSATGSNVAAKPRAIPSGALDSAPNSGRSASNGQKPSPLVPVDPSQTALRDLPRPSVAPIPQPVYARNIVVSGVAQVNGQTQVILKLPNESFSRYVSVGERVMDGKVLVKRVESPNAITPVVVLEEIGMEVPRRVGEKLIAPAKEGPR